MAPIIIGKMDAQLFVSTKDLIDSHAIKSASIKTVRIEIRPRDCCRPPSPGSATADVLRSSSAPHPRTPARSTIDSRRSKKRADRAKAKAEKKRQRLDLRRSRRKNLATD